MKEVSDFGLWSKSSSIETVSNGFIHTKHNVYTTKTVHQSFTSLVNDLAFHFGLTEIGEHITLISNLPKEDKK